VKSCGFYSDRSPRPMQSAGLMNFAEQIWSCRPCATAWMRPQAATSSVPRLTGLFPTLRLSRLRRIQAMAHPRGDCRSSFGHSGAVEGRDCGRVIAGVGHHQAVAEHDNPSSMTDDFLVVRHQHDRDAHLLVELPQDGDDLL